MRFIIQLLLTLSLIQLSPAIMATELAKAREDKDRSADPAPVIYYTIQSKASGYAAAVSMAKTREKEFIIEWTSRRSDEQKWRIVPSDKGGWFFFEAKHSGKVMTVAGTQETKVLQMSNQGLDSQLWRIRMDADGYARLISKEGKRCLSVSSPGGARGKHLVVQEKADTDDQKWSLGVVEFNDQTGFVPGFRPTVSF